MKRIKLFVTVLALIISVSNSYSQDISFYTPPANSNSYTNIDGRIVKNVIMFIGDGMGINIMQAARLKAVGADGKLFIEKLPILGKKTTHSADKLITDSAATATAMSTGYKTNNGMIGYSPDGKWLPTLLEMARDRGMATGLVATSGVTHATPASYAAHVEDRDNYFKIAEQMFDTRVNVLLGGGREYFIPQTTKGSKRKDGKDILKDFLDAGYSYATNNDELWAAQGEYILGFFQDGALDTISPDEPSVLSMTLKALEVLSKDDDGFFLMVEGSQIDWEAHDNELEKTIRQLLLFDMAVKAGYDFARQLGNTLIVVTADHETGGLILRGGNLKGENLKASWASGSHSPSDVLVYSYGPGSIDFAGSYDDTDIAKKIANLLNIKPFPGKKINPKY